MKIQLEMTLDIPSSAVEEAVQVFEKLGASVEHEVLLFRAVNEMSSFITVATELISWKLLLGTPLAVFISEIAKNAADDLYKNKKEIWAALKNKAAQPVAVVARCLTGLARSSTQDTRLLLVLLLPDDHLEAVLRVDVASEEEVAYTLAIFVHKVEAVCRVLKEELLAKDESVGESRPVRRVYLELLRDGSLKMKWPSDADHKQHELIIR